jgi:hypothetical protein
LIEGESDDDRLDDAAQDAALLRAQVEGDPDAFARLVARHQDRMWSIVLGIMWNPEDAADALQDAYIAAFRELSRRCSGDDLAASGGSQCLPRSAAHDEVAGDRTAPRKILIDGAGWAR